MEEAPPITQPKQLHYASALNNTVYNSSKPRIPSSGKSLYSGEGNEGNIDVKPYESVAPAVV